MGKSMGNSNGKLRGKSIGNQWVNQQVINGKLIGSHREITGEIIWNQWDRTAVNGQHSLVTR